MSVCGPGGQTEEDSGSEEVTTSGAAVREIYKQKPASKVVRVLTVVAYLLSVSLAAILLSVYYVCVWKSPQQLSSLNNTSDGVAGAPTANANQADPNLFAQQHTYSGGSDSPIESIGEIGTEGSNIRSTSTEMVPDDGESGNMDTSRNTTSLYDTSTTVDYNETPALNNDNHTGT